MFRTMLVYLAPLTTVVGLVVYLAASNPKAQELGRLAAAMGLLATLLLFGGREAVRLP